MFHKICIISLCALLSNDIIGQSVAEDPAPASTHAYAGKNNEFAYFVYKVKADEEFHTGLLLSSTLLLTDKKVIKAKTVIVCNILKVCEGAIGMVDTPPEKNYIYVLVAKSSESVQVKNAMYKGGKFTVDLCVTLGIDHEPGTLASFEQYVLECDCKHMDGLVCNGKILGAIIFVGNKKTVAPYSDLLTYGNELAGINGREEKMEEILEEMQDVERTTMGVRASDADTIKKNSVIVIMSVMLGLHLSILRGK